MPVRPFEVLAPKAFVDDYEADWTVSIAPDSAGLLGTLTERITELAPKTKFAMPRSLLV